MRDSGVTHALLGITTVNDLLGHPVAGGSWEGCVIENLSGALPKFALEDLKPARRFVVHGGGENFTLGKGIKALSLRNMMTTLSRALNPNFNASQALY